MSVYNKQNPIEKDDLLPISILFESYSYFRQRRRIENILNEKICEWLSDDEILNTHKLKFCSFFLKRFLLKDLSNFYNLLDIKIDALIIGKNDDTYDKCKDPPELSFNGAICSKYNNINDIIDLGAQYFIALLCISEELNLIFEDLQHIYLKQGDIIYFNSDCRYINLKTLNNDPEYISFKFLVQAKVRSEIQEWWCNEKHIDKRYNFSVRDF